MCIKGIIAWEGCIGDVHRSKTSFALEFELKSSLSKRPWLPLQYMLSSLAYVLCSVQMHHISEFRLSLELYEASQNTVSADKTRKSTSYANTKRSANKCRGVIVHPIQTHTVRTISIDIDVYYITNHVYQHANCQIALPQIFVKFIVVRSLHYTH